MLDDRKIIQQRDSNSALTIASLQYQQVGFKAAVRNAQHDGRIIKNIVVAGMGGSALAALLVKVWLKNDLKKPFEIIRNYNLPKYVGKNTLVIASSYSGNTEETINCLSQAKQCGAQIGIIASSGELIKVAESDDIAHVPLPIKLQPRMAVIYNLRALISLLVNFGLTDKEKLTEISGACDWLQEESLSWGIDIPVAKNYAKKLANHAVGKNAIFYGGELTAPIAYKWKISWNENAKNIAFWNELPEFNHNEFIGWTSHPIEKPFVVFDIISDLENPQILKRFKVSDKLLSGKRPKSIEIKLAGDTLIKQLLWGSILADFASIYLAILNNVNPTPVPLIEKLKEELA